MGFSLITISGKFKDAANKPANGRLTATLSETMTNPKGGVDTVTTAPIIGTITNEQLLSMKLFANNDPETLPTRTFYTFKLFLFNTPEEVEFKAIVPFNAVESEISYTELFESSGKTGTRKIKPKLNAEQTTINEVATALVQLELAEWSQTSSPDANEFTG